MANIGAGLFQGMPVTTSLSASSLNESSGARTPVATLGAGGARGRHAARARAAVLGPAEGGAGGDHHRRRRLRHDRRQGVPSPLPRRPRRLLDRRRGAGRGPLGRRARGRRGRHGAVAGVARLRRVAPGIPLLGREPGRQVFRDWRCTRTARRSTAWSCSGSTGRCSSRPPTSSRAGFAPSPRAPSGWSWWCSIWSRSTSSTPTAPARSGACRGSSPIAACGCGWRT